MTRTMDYARRIRLFREEVRKHRLDSFLVTNETNVSYLSGFWGSDAALLVTAGGKDFFLTDSRYIEEAAEVIKGFVLQVVEKSTYKTIQDLAKARRLKKTGFESMNLPYEVASKLKELLPDTRLVPIRGLVEGTRAVKEEAEIKLIKNSIRLTKEVLKAALGFVRCGVSEESLSKRIELEFVKKGAHPAFEPIVASGPDSSRPHAKAGGRKISKNSVVMIDIGCNLDGYNSDMTRMAFLGRVNDKFKKIYNIVRKARELALDMIRPGMRAAKVDTAARGYIEKEGFGAFFGHSLGHGVGMDVHEEPVISKNSEEVLRTGMVFTVEPAIYIPKFGGVRIEDMILVTEKGYEVLTR